MEFKAEIDIMPHDALLDPQGKAVSASMKNLGLAEISEVRIGKHISLHVSAPDRATAEAKVDEACRRLLANQIMEKYSFSLHELQTA
jgi:phosphoribosylformylglycinamidine synthase